MSMTLILSAEWDEDILYFLQREVVETDHPYVMLRVEPDAECLTLTSSLGSLSGFQLTYHWPIEKNPITEAWCYKIAVNGLVNFLKLSLPNRHLVAMTICEGRIYLQLSEPADMFGYYNLATDGAKHWLEWVSDEEDRNFEQLPQKEPWEYKMSASDFGRGLKTAAKYIKLTPKSQQLSSSTNKSQILQITFRDDTALVQGQANGNTVAITMKSEFVNPETDDSVVSVAPLDINIAAKMAQVLVSCAGNIKIKLTENHLRIERKDWELSVKLTESHWNWESITKTFEQLPESIWIEIPSEALVRVLPKLAVADNLQKERLCVETYEAFNPNYTDEFRLKVNQDHVGAMIPVKTAHPFPSNIDVSFNYACFKHILDTLPPLSDWAFSIRGGFVFCDRSRQIYFSMACIHEGRR